MNVNVCFRRRIWLSSSVILCTFLLKPISLALRQNKQTPFPLKALLDLRLAFKGKIFYLPRFNNTWKPVRRCFSLHFYLPFDSWFYCSCSDGQPMKTRVETDYPRGPCCPFRRTKQHGLWERDCTTSWSHASHFVDGWHLQRCQIRFFPHRLNGWHDYWTFVGEWGMGDFTDLVCIGRIFFPNLSGVRHFFPDI